MLLPGNVRQFVLIDQRNLCALLATGRIVRK